ncbi:uncharacterized protein A4U43_C01F35390 [Asparagus officinalis]|uniref:Uncharacterized protein n=1 Tax=Asparagus officinalis TaxID=4686 RepID=A0A5P1FUW5_ASPOF|nr:uncharacterized protein A4U43_C01F35390 [Asparagus officinalis]
MNFPVFASLLEMAEEELGFQPAGGLVITCDVDFFAWAIKALQKDEERFKAIGLDGFLEMFSGSGPGSGLCKDLGLVPARCAVQLICIFRAFIAEKSEAECLWSSRTGPWVMLDAAKFHGPLEVALN